MSTFWIIYLVIGLFVSFYFSYVYIFSTYPGFYDFFVNVNLVSFIGILVFMTLNVFLWPVFLLALVSSMF